VLRWRLLLEEFDYEFQYTPGKDNVVADMISWYPTFNVNQHSIEELTTIDELNNFPLDFSTISKHQADDKQLQKNLLKNPLFYEIKFVNGTKLVFYKNKVFLPASLLQPIVTWYHEKLNHPGVLRTLNTINMHFFCQSSQTVRSAVRRILSYLHDAKTSHPEILSSASNYCNLYSMAMRSH